MYIVTVVYHGRWKLSPNNNETFLLFLLPNFHKLADEENCLAKIKKNLPNLVKYLSTSVVENDPLFLTARGIL